VKFTKDQVRALMAEQTRPLTTAEVARAAVNKYVSGPTFASTFAEPRTVRAALDELVADGEIVSYRKPAYSYRPEPDPNPYSFLARTTGRDVWWMDKTRAGEFRDRLVDTVARHVALTAAATRLARFAGVPADDVANTFRSRVKITGPEDGSQPLEVSLRLTAEQLDRIATAIDLAPVDAEPSNANR
jgi:hypothetical protein